MTTIANLFSNFTDLVKPKSVTDNVTDYNKNNPTPISLSLNQGRKFKKYQKQINSNLEEEADILSGIEGFQQLNIQPGPRDTLTKQTLNVLRKTNISQTQEQIIDNLRTEYDSTMTQYEKLLDTVNGGTSDYINRVSPNNPYLGKVIQLQGGALFYVTNQGVAKQITSMNIYSAVSGKNGFPPQGQLTPVSIPWNRNYSTPGTTLPTTPPLLIGSPVKVGQSVGNEGVNVYVNTMVNNPQSSYVGCYNNLPPSTEIMFVPKMTSSNNANGYYAYASSVYNNDNNFTGPWNAFDQNVDTWWHSGVSSSSNLYNSITGQYTGTTQLSFINSSGVQTTVKGEWLQLNLPNVGTPNAVNFPLTRYEIQGRQGCCGNPNGRDPNTWYILGWNNSNSTWNQVDYQSNIAFNWKLLSFDVSNPKPYAAYVIITTVTGSNAGGAGDRSCLQIGTWNLYTSSNYVSNPKSAMTNVGSMNYEQCESYAVNSGKKFFGLQSVDSNGNGNCMVSNDLAGSQMYGVGVNYNKVSIWDSKTYGNNPGSTMSFNNGSINVLNSSSASIFSTPNNTAKPSNYIGCYGDKSTRAMALYNSGKQQYSNSQCQQVAESQNATYYGLQNSTSGTNAQCALSSNLGQAQQYGLASNCTKISDGSFSGGGWSNAVYSTKTPTNSYFLILQDDGNMCIYLGTPSNNQGGVWCSMTNGKQQQANPNFTAAKGKYGQNFIVSGSTLAPGDFVGSTNGNLVLIMQTDGNLVLYTFTTSSKCSTSGGKNVGSQNTNGLYQLNQVGVSANMAQIAYIDQDSQLHKYPTNNVQYGNTYTTINGADSGGNDISGAAYGNATVDQCQTSCNKNNACAGFAFSNNVCYPKTSKMYPIGQIQGKPNVNLYLRNKSPVTPPIGVKNTTNNIDTISYQNYVNGGAISNAYGLSKISSVQKKQLEQMQTKMNLLSNQINNLTNKFTSGDEQLNEQSETNVQGVDTYVKDIKTTNNKIKNYPISTYENILQDSDIVVLQKNYDYLFWSIVAVTTVIISMNIVKK
jgi:hypothetical protein